MAKPKAGTMAKPKVYRGASGLWTVVLPDGRHRLCSSWGAALDHALRWWLGRRQAVSDV